MDSGDDDQRDERTTSLKNVCWLYYLSVVVFCCYLCCLPHAGYGRGIKTEDGGGDNGTRGQHFRRKYVDYTTFCCFGFFSLLSPTCWLWRRDNDEVDGGDDDQRDERTTSPKNVCWLYYLSVVVVFLVVISLVSHMLAMLEGQQRGGWRRDERTTCTSPKKVRWLYYLSVVVFCYLFVVSHMAEGQR